MSRALLSNRPICEEDGCDCEAALIAKHQDGVTGYFRVVCSRHHCERVAENRGKPSYIHVLAANAGFEEVWDYMNFITPHRQWMKDYCENIDGRLGFKCTTTISHKSMLQADHIDGNPSNDVESNMQTLCACCHIYKTIKNGDLKTPGRKTLGVR